MQSPEAELEEEAVWGWPPRGRSSILTEVCATSGFRNLSTLSSGWKPPTFPVLPELRLSGGYTHDLKSCDSKGPTEVGHQWAG